MAVLFEPQLGMGYEALVTAAQAAEAAGFSAVYRSDHYSTPLPAASPTWTDAWTTLAGIARETSRVALGTLVSPVTLRPPWVTASAAATAQSMSGGRVILGLGAGWDQEEHASFGVPFPPLSERLRILDGQVMAIRSLWRRPDGPQPTPRIVIGGHGGPRSRAIAVRHADGYSILRADPESVSRINRRLDDECRAAGREPRSLRRSALVGCLLGHGAVLERRRDRLGRLLGLGKGIDGWLAEREGFWALGSVTELEATAAAYHDAGSDELVLEIFDGQDLALIAEAGSAVQRLRLA